MIMKVKVARAGECELHVPPLCYHRQPKNGAQPHAQNQRQAHPSQRLAQRRRLDVVRRPPALPTQPPPPQLPHQKSQQDRAEHHPEQVVGHDQSCLQNSSDDQPAPARSPQQPLIGPQRQGEHPQAKRLGQHPSHVWGHEKHIGRQHIQPCRQHSRARANPVPHK